MAEMIAFDLVSPEKLLLSTEAALVVVPGTDGNIGVMPRHMPLLTSLQPGLIDVYESRDGVAHRLFVAGGFCEVTPERCTVLAEAATPVSELDLATIDKQIQDSLEDVEDAKTPAERHDAERALKIARGQRAAVMRASAH